MLLAAAAYEAGGQGWEWGRRGGSTSSFQGGAMEEVIDMTADRLGNVYLLSYVGRSSLNVYGIPKTGYGGVDILLSSFSCGGVLRWMKLIGGSANERAYAVRVDTLGHVYVAGSVIPWGTDTTRFDADTSLPLRYNKIMFLIQYDTSGHYRWLRMPQADTTNLNYNPRIFDMDVSAAGSVYWYCYLYPGLLSGTGHYVIDSAGVYVLEYDAEGNLSGVKRLDLELQTTTGETFHFLRDHRSGRHYMGCYYFQGVLRIGGEDIDHSLVVAAFDSGGHFLWKRGNKTRTTAMSARPAVDREGNIYIGGSVSGEDEINNDTVVSALMHHVPFAIKMDSSGVNQWVVYARTNAATSVYALTLNGNEVVIAGDYPGRIEWPGYPDVLNHSVNQGYDAFITRLDRRSGAVVGMDSIGGDFGFNDAGRALTADGRGNVYVGGYFDSRVWPGSDTLTSIGGPSDFFVAKYGSGNCGCILPVADFTYTMEGGGNVLFHYAGGAPWDSLGWDFGDGAGYVSAAGQGATSHAYVSPGVYTVCLTAFSSCGGDSLCREVSLPAGIGSLPYKDAAFLRPSPNPASGTTWVYYGTGRSAGNNDVLEVYDLSGRLRERRSLNDERVGMLRLDVSGYAAGLYVVVLRSGGAAVAQTKLSVY